MIEAVIFDMDGVIVDNMKVHVLAFAEMCRRYGKPFDIEKFKPMAGRGNDEIMPVFLDADIIEKRGIPALAAEKEAIYREIYAPDIAPVEGLVEFLEQMRSHGIKCAVGSSGCKENVDFVLDKCRVREYFDVVVNCDMVTRCKPDPEIYLKAVELLGSNASSCIVFEDALAGMEAARRAGIETVAIATTLPRAEIESHSDAAMIIDDFTEINFERLESLA